MSDYGNVRSEVERELTTLSEAERLGILEEATEKMKNESALDLDLKLEVIAAQTRNYTGSELELLVKIAQGGALASQLLKNKGIPTTEGIKLTMEDFISAMDVVKPEMESLKENLKRSSSVP